MRVLSLSAPGLLFLFGQPAPTPAAGAVGARVIDIWPFLADGIIGEIVCKAENHDDLIIVIVADSAGPEAAYTETKMTQAEYNAELARSLGRLLTLPMRPSLPATRRAHDLPEATAQKRGRALPAVILSLPKCAGCCWICDCPDELITPTELRRLIAALAGVASRDVLHKRECRPQPTS